MRQRTSPPKGTVNQAFRPSAALRPIHRPIIDVTRFARPRRRGAGDPPGAEYEPVRLAVFADGEERWALDLLRSASRPRHWAALKLYALGSVAAPSTYWLSWSLPRQQFARSHALGLLEGQRPELFRAVRSVLRELPVRGGLPSPPRPRLEDLV